MSPTPSLVLGIDASVPPSSIALVHGEQLLGVDTGPFGKGSDAWVHAAVGELLGGHQRQAADLEAIVACSGPGTFTGIRVALATALGLARGAGCPATGIGTTEVMLAGLRRECGTDGPGSLLACTDARRGQVYAQMQPLESDDPPPWGPEALTPAELLDRLAGGSRVIATGTGLLLDERLGARVEAVLLPHPLAAYAALEVARRVAAGGLADLPPAVPVYVRPPDARAGTNPLLAARRRRG